VIPAKGGDKDEDSDGSSLTGVLARAKSCYARAESCYAGTGPVPTEDVVGYDGAGNSGS